MAADDDSVNRARARAEHRWESGTAMLANATHGIEALSSRLHALDRAVDAERAATVAAAGLAIVGFLAGATHRRGWFGLAGIAAALFAQQRVTGWSPAVAAMKACGLRTRREVELEREAVTYALRALGRGSA